MSGDRPDADSVFRCVPSVAMVQIPPASPAHWNTMGGRPGAPPPAPELDALLAVLPVTVPELAAPLVATVAPLPAVAPPAPLEAAAWLPGSAPGPQAEVDTAMVATTVNAIQQVS